MIITKYKSVTIIKKFLFKSQAVFNHYGWNLLFSTIACQTIFDSNV